MKTRAPAYGRRAHQQQGAVSRRAGGNLKISDAVGTIVVTEHLILLRGRLTYDEEGDAILDIPAGIGEVGDGSGSTSDVVTIVVPPGGYTDLGNGSIRLNFLTKVYGEQHGLYTNAAAGAALTLDLSAYNWFDITLTANCTITFTNPPASGTGSEWTLILRQGGVGSFTVTWLGTLDWQDTDGTGGGAAPTLYTAVGAVDVIRITTLDGGTTYGGGQERGGATGLTVQEEGSPLTTSTTTLNFVGPGVTASGAGATKTITVTGTSATDTNIWRPVIDGAGTVIATGSGEALMAFGPA